LKILLRKRAYIGEGKAAKTRVSFKAIKKLSNGDGECAGSKGREKASSREKREQIENPGSPKKSNKKRGPRVGETSHRPWRKILRESSLDKDRGLGN